MEKRKALEEKVDCQPLWLTINEENTLYIIHEESIPPPSLQAIFNNLGY
jgi:hypothetical protein